jgi:hypothetical protein
MVNALPNQQDEITSYFTDEFYPYYMSLTNRVKLAFHTRQKSLTQKVKFTKDMSNYQQLHAEQVKLNDYYGLLLTAAKHRYGIWLNDLIMTDINDKRRKTNL